MAINKQEVYKAIRNLLESGEPQSVGAVSDILHRSALHVKTIMEEMQCRNEIIPTKKFNRSGFFSLNPESEIYDYGRTEIARPLADIFSPQEEKILTFLQQESLADIKTISRGTNFPTLDIIDHLDIFVRNGFVTYVEATGCYQLEQDKLNALIKKTDIPLQAHDSQIRWSLKTFTDAVDGIFVKELTPYDKEKVSKTMHLALSLINVYMETWLSEDEQAAFKPIEQAIIKTMKTFYNTSERNKKDDQEKGRTIVAA